MAFINKKSVYTKFLKGYNIIFFRLVIEFIKFLPDRFLLLFKLLYGEVFPSVSLEFRNSSGYLLKLLF